MKTVNEKKKLPLKAAAHHSSPLLWQQVEPAQFPTNSCAAQTAPEAQSSVRKHRRKAQSALHRAPQTGCGLNNGPTGPCRLRAILGGTRLACYFCQQGGGGEGAALGGGRAFSSLQLASVKWLLSSSSCALAPLTAAELPSSPVNCFLAFVFRFPPVHAHRTFVVWPDLRRRVAGLFSGVWSLSDSSSMVGRSGWREFNGSRGSSLKFSSLSGRGVTGQRMWCFIPAQVFALLLISRAHRIKAKRITCRFRGFLVCLRLLRLSSLFTPLKVVYLSVHTLVQ